MRSVKQTQAHFSSNVGWLQRWTLLSSSLAIHNYMVKKVTCPGVCSNKCIWGAEVKTLWQGFESLGSTGRRFWFQARRWLKGRAKKGWALYPPTDCRKKETGNFISLTNFSCSKTISDPKWQQTILIKWSGKKYILQNNSTNVLATGLLSLTAWTPGEKKMHFYSFKNPSHHHHHLGLRKVWIKIDSSNRIKEIREGGEEDKNPNMPRGFLPNRQKVAV